MPLESVLIFVLLHLEEMDLFLIKECVTLLA